LYKLFTRSLDASYDQILQSVGSMAVHYPKLIVDSIMIWRKSKNDLMDGSDLLPDSLKDDLFLKRGLKKKQIDFFIRERRCILSNFILCRALEKILENLTKETLPEDLGVKIEDMIFGQLKNADPYLLSNLMIVNLLGNTSIEWQMSMHLLDWLVHYQI
jgi:hypothetical protein